jgi:hypothetical protein
MAGKVISVGDGHQELSFVSPTTAIATLRRSTTKELGEQKAQAGRGTNPGALTEKDGCRMPATIQLRSPTN